MHEPPHTVPKYVVSEPDRLVLPMQRDSGVAISKAALGFAGAFYAVVVGGALLFLAGFLALLATVSVSISMSVVAGLAAIVSVGLAVSMLVLAGVSAFVPSWSWLSGRGTLEITSTGFELVGMTRALQSIDSMKVVGGPRTPVRFVSGDTTIIKIHSDSERWNDEAISWLACRITELTGIVVEDHRDPSMWAGNAFQSVEDAVGHIDPLPPPHEADIDGMRIRYLPDNGSPAYVRVTNTGLEGRGGVVPMSDIVEVRVQRTPTVFGELSAVHVRTEERWFRVFRCYCSNAAPDELRRFAWIARRIEEAVLAARNRDRGTESQVPRALAAMLTDRVQ